MNTPRPRPAVVLLAEDDRELRRLLGDGLRQLGLHVEEVANGLELCDRLQQDVLPDLLISDQRMPGLSGLEVVEQLRANDKALPPFVLLTAFGDASVHELAKRLGAVATLDKPFDIQELHALVGRVLSQRMSIASP